MSRSDTCMYLPYRSTMLLRFCLEPRGSGVVGQQQETGAEEEPQSTLYVHSSPDLELRRSSPTVIFI